MEKLTYEQFCKEINILKQNDVKPWPDGCYHIDKDGKYIPFSNRSLPASGYTFWQQIVAGILIVPIILVGWLGR